MVTRRPGVLGGAASIGETGVPVWAIVERRRRGRSDAAILAEYPELSEDDLRLAFDYYAEHRLEIQEDALINSAC
jgi:uncharacterized protein (DUF433 family)